MKNIVLLVLLSIVACSSLKEIDKPVCVEINLSKGYCTTIISGRGFPVDDTNLLEGKTWFDARIEMIQVPITTWTALKKYLIKNCRRSQKCEENIDSWTRSMLTIDQELSKKQ
jgi:hypothetical protein